MERLPRQSLKDVGGSWKRDAHHFPNGSKILYAHLGGVLAINSNSYVYRNG